MNVSLHAHAPALLLSVIGLAEEKKFTFADFVRCWMLSSIQIKKRHNHTFRIVKHILKLKKCYREDRQS